MEPPSGILAMTLTLRNKVNGSYILRPENLTKDDDWSVEYTLSPVAEERRAWALYQACQTRRKKKLDDNQPDRDAQKVDFYIQNLRKLTRSGREFQKEMAERDKARPLQVLGRDLQRSEEV